jgi:hypothetical protein
MFHWNGNKVSYISRNLLHVFRDLFDDIHDDNDDDERIASGSGVQFTPALMIILPVILLILLCICIHVMWRQNMELKSRNISTSEPASEPACKDPESLEENVDDAMGRRRARILWEVLFPVQGSTTRKVRSTW